jgi:hypothetical protein
MNRPAKTLNAIFAVTLDSSVRRSAHACGEDKMVRCSPTVGIAELNTGFQS